MSQSIRISRDHMFMEIARIVSQRGTCDRARVGAVLVDSSNKIRSIGYNGSPHGEPHCEDSGHIMFDGHCIRTVHAEENCIHDVVPRPGRYTMYVTHYPCKKCQVSLYEWVMSSPGVTLLVMYDNDYGSHTSFEGIPEVNKVLQFSQFIVE